MDNCYFYEIKHSNNNWYDAGYIEAISESDAVSKVLDKFIGIEVHDLNVHYVSTWNDFLNNGDKYGWD